MPNLKAIDENQYKVDFEISKGYINFSSELLRISLFAMAGFGALVLTKIKGESTGLPDVLEDPGLFLVSMGLFTLCAGAALFHRYFASDTMSWYIAWLRAEADGRIEAAEKEKKGYRKLLKRSKWALILSEVFFGGGVLFFVIAICRIVLI